MKLALGTVQFGLNYGIANTMGQTPDTEVMRIVARARAKGIDTLDTAAAYGTSEKSLGNIGLDGWKIVTKVPSCRGKTEDCRLWVLNHVRRSLSELRVERLYGVLLHDASDLLTERGSEIVTGLHELKAEGLVEKIGYSIYSPDSLENLLNAMPLPDLIQAPLNVLDQRLVKTGYLNRLVDLGVEVHVRSVFLQGLLLMPPKSRPAVFNKWSDLWQRWDALVEQQGGSALKVCLGFIRQHSDVSRVVVGVESLPQLEQLLTEWETTPVIDAVSLACDDPELVEPRHWNKHDA